MSIQMKVPSGVGAELAISVRGYERPESEDPDDGNWLVCDVHVRTSGHSASYGASFTTHDFVDFREQLKKTLHDLQGEATFTTMENALEFALVFSRTGHVLVRGKTALTGGMSAELSFSFETDQSYVAETAQGLDQIVHAFPVRG